MSKAIEIDTGNTIGIKRKVDQYNRVCIPIDIAERLGIRIGDIVEVFSTNDGIFIKK